jgi:hypothetical protein
MLRKIYLIKEVNIMYKPEREQYYKKLLSIYNIPTDEELQQPISNLKPVIDITYYRSKKEAVKGKYNLNTGVLMIDGISFVWDKQKVIH